MEKYTIVGHIDLCRFPVTGQDLNNDKGYITGWNRLVGTTSIAFWYGFREHKHQCTLGVNHVNTKGLLNNFGGGAGFDWRRKVIDSKYIFVKKSGRTFLRLVGIIAIILKKRVEL